MSSRSRSRSKSKSQASTRSRSSSVGKGLSRSRSRAASAPKNKEAPVTPTSSSSRFSQRKAIMGHDENKPWFTVGYEHAPHYLKHNVFIHTGYRVQLTLSQCARSLFRVHNQTTNIHTHLWATVMAIVLLFLVMSVDGGLVMQRASFRDRFFIAFEVFAQLALFTFSFIFHLFDAHSENTYLRLVKCDYFGIILAFSLSLSCFSYFAFACDSALRIGYVLFFFAAVFPASFVLLSPSMASPRHRALRAFSFAATIGTGLVAVAHFAFREVIGAPEGDPTAQAMRSVLSFCLQSYGAQVVLVLLYVWRFPERYIRSWWIDHWFHSHTICHVICAASSLLWFRAILEISDLRLRQVPACL